MYAICSRRDKDDFRKLTGRRRYNDYYYILQMERMHSGWTTVETAGGAKRLQEFTIRLLTSISTSFFLNFCKNKESLSLFIYFILAHEDLGATSNKLMADASQKSRCGRIISA
jgi:DNA phosphorothioation-dependent restriction protein DptG